MPAYLEATARSFPNPISSQEFTKPFKRPASGKYRSHSSVPELGTGREYYITFEGSGPGSMPLGKDIVHYIGDNEKTCVANCNGGERQPIYRFYRGSKRDHKYTNQPNIQKRDMGNENESWKKAASGYNKEPRSGRPAFYILDKPADGAVPLKAYYSYWPDNSALVVGSPPFSVGGGRGQYKEIGTLGYVYTNGSAVPGLVPLYHYRHGDYSQSSGKDVDDFYTVNPAKEVDLKGGPIAPKKKLKERYQYQGILCYVFSGDAPDAPRKQVRDVGQIGPTGQCVDKTGWYEFNDLWTWGTYQRGRGAAGDEEGTPGVIGFGNPDNADIVSAEANFEWLYGLNGAIKGAVPRFLGFEDSYDSQFLYYLYDTTYPWNGPIFGIQYQLNDIPCCPNTTCPDPSTGRPSPCCIPNEHYYSHFYQIREDSWETTKTRISINDISTIGVRESFQTIGTDDRRILFRYTGGNTNGSWKRGDKINGWDIASVVYYGDEIKAGLIELNAQSSGAAFTYGQVYTSPDGAEATALAGYGIPNKAAFAGVYEFPKRISYWKVQINPKALIPNRTLDRAEAEAVIGSNGEIVKIKIINGGRGYRNPTVTAINPKVMEDYSAGDLAKYMKDGVITTDDDTNVFPTPDSSYTLDDNTRDIWEKYGVDLGEIPFATDKNNEKIKLKKAELQVAEIDEIGCIQSIRVVNGGSGYSQDEPPTIYIVEPETFAYEQPPVANGNKAQNKKTVEDLGNNFASKFKDVMPAENFNALSQVMNEQFTEAITGPSTAVIDTYLRAPDIDDRGEQSMCFDIPQKCLSVPIAQDHLTTLLNNWDGLWVNTTLHPGVASWEKENSGAIAEGFAKSDQYTNQMNSIYGAFGGSRCITQKQPNLYNVRRWFDMPCAYLDIGSDGEEKAFGFLPYKYCASDQSEAQFRVSLEIEGKVIGSMGADFMDYLDGFKKPKLTPSRSPKGGYKTWNCTRSSVNGRCYRDPGNPNDIIFVPVGLDENTFDYNRNGYTEYEQFKLWLGDNLTGGGLTAGTNSWSWIDDETTTTTNPDGSSSSTTTSYGGTNVSSYTAFTVDCTPNPGDTNVPNHDCWDKYVRASGAPSDAPLDVYCGWDSQGNGMPGERFWEIRGPAVGTDPSGHTTPTGPVNPFCAECSGWLGFIYTGGGAGTSPACGLDNVNDASIAIDPQRIYNHSDGKGKVMQMGGYDGTMIVRNWLSGGVIALARTIDNYGNPYFDECDGDRNWNAGKEINDDII
jgi:hypothetical protein